MAIFLRTAAYLEFLYTKLQTLFLFITSYFNTIHYITVFNDVMKVIFIY